MQIIGLIVTLCLILGISVVIAIIIFFPYSTVNQTYWEPIFRSYDENIRAVSKSHLLTALLDRYEKYVRPFTTSPSEGKAPPPVMPTRRYAKTTELLQKMVDSQFSYVKMFPDEDKVSVFTVRVVNTRHEESTVETRGKARLSIGKLVMFSIPTFALINKNENSNLTLDEQMKLNTCWEAYTPGIPITVAFSSDYKYMAIAYRILISGGYKYRVRYFHDIKCNASLSEVPGQDYYAKYAAMTENEQSEYTNVYDDLYLFSHSDISALAVEHNKLAYSILYDTKIFHYAEKNTTTGKWVEKADTPAATHTDSLYVFCHDLFMIRRSNEVLLISFTRKGQTLSRLDQDIDVYEKDDNSINAPLQQVYSEREGAQATVSFSLSEINAPPTVNSLFVINEDRDLAFIVKRHDCLMLFQLPSKAMRNASAFVISRKVQNQIVAGLKDLSIVASYPKEMSSIVFYVNQRHIHSGKVIHSFIGLKEMSLSQLPKSLQKKRIIDIIIFNCDDFVDENNKQ